MNRRNAQSPNQQPFTNLMRKRRTRPLTLAWAGPLLRAAFLILTLSLQAVGQALPPDNHGPALQPSLEPAAAASINAPAGNTPPPCPPSPVIKTILWAPKETILRRAKGSDNWPVTWADDDALYAAYGDGNGFEPYVKEKLSLGLARVKGLPPNFTGENLRAPSLEARGADKHGRKASGLLSLQSVLYLLARNVTNAQLAWSADHGATWTWADWKFRTSFGCPTFLNFGRNYAGARDGYVYIYSPDSDSAYTPARRFVLARVPRDALRRQEAYEFFLQLEPNGQPRWTKNIAERGAVFSHPGRCYRSGITYNPILKRYLWVQIHPQSRHPQGPRFQGGFGVYDAPEPWGPWSTVFYCREWDVGPGETASFPTKWISPNGRVLYLLFSGDDCFSVRRAELFVNSQPRAP